MSFLCFVFYPYIISENQILISVQNKTGQGRLGHIRIGQDRLGQVRTGQGRLGQPRIEQERTRQVRIDQSALRLIKTLTAFITLFAFVQLMQLCTNFVLVSKNSSFNELYVAYKTYFFLFCAAP